MATADVRTFWEAFVRLLLKCVAALGFATAATAANAVRPQGEAPAAPALVPAEVAGTAAAPGHDAAGAEPRAAAIPAPRPAYAGPPRRDRRNRTLPPTMKQRIHAEAHGASPSPRSVLAADVPGAFFDVPDAARAAQGPAQSAAAAAPTLPAAPAAPAAALIPSPRPRAHEALCE